MKDDARASEKLCPMGLSRPSTTAPRRISIICGSLLRYDAISECALASLEAAAVAGAGETIEARIFCLESNIIDSRIHVMESVRALITDPFYQTSHIILHHFGIVSEMHGALAVAPRSAYVIVEFYGVTPPQYMSKASHQVISKSFIQIGLFENADEIVVNSAYLDDELRRIGIDKPIRRINLFGANIGGTPDERLRSTPREQLDVIYCGRFVEAKQVLPLLQALDSLLPDFPSLRLTLVGLADSSDPSYFEQIKTQAFVSKLEVVFELNRTADQVIAMIRAADLLVLPSLHEGFGMPVAEALAALTPVVCSDAGSLPEVAGGLALLFKSTDMDALTATLDRALTARAAGEVMTDRGSIPYSAWAVEAGAFAKKYQRAFFVDQWKSVLTEVLTRTASRPLLASMRTDTFRSVLPHDELHDPGEAQLLGRIVALKTLGRMETDATSAVDMLHRWAFGRSLFKEDVGYWRGMFERRGIDGVLSKLSRSSEVRSSSLRLRSLAGLTATLLERSERDPGTTSNHEMAVPAMSRSEIAQVLGMSRTPIQFVESAYMLILNRGPDSEDLSNTVKLALNRDNWNDIISAFYNSDEYKRCGAIAN